MRIRSTRPLLSLSLCTLAFWGLAAGCGGGKDEGSGDTTTEEGGGDGTTGGTTGAGDTADTGGAGGEPEEVCTEPADMECVDQIILDFSLHDDRVSEGDVTTEVDGADFVSSIDATGGGYDRYTRNAWVYVKFTPDGLQKVEIDDETALESMDWDLSMRRYIIRLNGGTSGPSCVGSASFLESTYDGLTEVPEGLPYIYDDFYTDDCTLTTDSSGLPGSPSVALGTWWTYDGCVQTTMVPHLIQLADGHIVKMRVEEYYESGQEACNNGTGSGNDSGNLQLRWTYMN